MNSNIYFFSILILFNLKKYSAVEFSLKILKNETFYVYGKIYASNPKDFRKNLPIEYDSCSITYLKPICEHLGYDDLNVVAEKCQDSNSIKH